MVGSWCGFDTGGLKALSKYIVGGANASIPCKRCFCSTSDVPFEAVSGYIFSKLNRMVNLRIDKGGVCAIRCWGQPV
jgi:hypothetical protein